MTKRERERLAEAVKLLCTDDGWDAAMRILLPLAGLRSPAMEAADRAKAEGAIATQHDTTTTQPDVALDALPDVLHLTDTPGSAELHKREGPGGTCWEGRHRWKGNRRPEGGQESHDYRSGGGPDA
jgi:hypothetical protein